MPSSLRDPPTRMPKCNRLPRIQIVAVPKPTEKKPFLDQNVPDRRVVTCPPDTGEPVGSLLQNPDLFRRESVDEIRLMGGHEGRHLDFWLDACSRNSLTRVSISFL